MLLAIHDARDVTINSRLKFLSKTILLFTGALFFNVAQAATQHIVEPGETISTIAAQYNIKKTALIDFNRLETVTIEAGQLLQIPDENSRHNLYKVAPGDSLSSLATKYKVDLNDLARVNRMNPESGLLIDSIIIIPARGKTSQETAIDNTEAVSNTATKKADANKSQSKVSSKASTNKGATRYRIKYGDTLSKVAELHNVSLSHLAEANNIGIEDPLYFGRYLTIPLASTRTTTAIRSSTQVSSDSAAPSKPIPIQYAVQPGDTLLGIANKFKCNFIDIAKLNGIDYNDNLIIGQILTIPSKNN